MGVCLVLLIMGTTDSFFAQTKFDHNRQIAGWYAPWDLSLGSLMVTGGIYSHRDINNQIGTYRRAIDIGANENTPVLAAFSGVVVTSRWIPDSADGDSDSEDDQKGLIVIEHDEGVVAGYCSVYLHLNESAFGWNSNTIMSEHVVTGQYLGKSGIGWNAAHIHFAVYEQFHPNGKYDNQSHCDDYSTNGAHMREVIPHFVNDNRDPVYGNYIPSFNSMTNPPADSMPMQNYRTFSDVPLYSNMETKQLNPFYPYVEVIADMKGTQRTGTFGVGFITKAEFVSMLIRTMGEYVTYNVNGDHCIFEDVCFKSNVHYHSIRKCVTLGICSSGSKFEPDKLMWRYAMAKFVSLAREGRNAPNANFPACTTRPYTDVPVDDTFCRYVKRLKAIYAQEGEVLTSDSRFSGDSAISRIAAAKYIVIGLGEKDRIPKFVDVWWDSPFYRWVMDNFDEGIVKGCRDNLYCASDNATPGQLAKMIVEGMGEARTYSDGYMPFKDVPPTDTFYHYIRRLVELGRGKGYFVANPAAFFGTNDALNRYKMVEMVVWALEIKGVRCNKELRQKFPDVPPSDGFYREVQCAYKYGIVRGKSDGRFHGSDSTNRLEVAKVIALAINYRFGGDNRDEPGSPTNGQCRSSTRSFSVQPLGEVYFKLNEETSECYTINYPFAQGGAASVSSKNAVGTSKQLVTLSPSLFGINTNFTIELLDINEQLVKKVENVSAFNPIELEWDAAREPVRYMRITNRATGTKSNYAYFGTNVESSICNEIYKVCASAANNDLALAVDGNSSTAWSAGTFAPVWYEIDLGSMKPFYGLNIVLEQSPSGNTNFLVSTAGEDRLFEEYHSFVGNTQAGSELKRQDVTGFNVRYVRIQAISSPSWISFREVVIYNNPPQTNLYRTWEGFNILEQTETACQNTRLAVYLVRKNADGTYHIIVHRENAPEVWDHSLITDVSSRALEVSGCEVRLTQGSRKALHILEPTGDPTYAWRIRFVKMEDLQTIFRTWNGVTIISQLETMCEGSRIAVYLVDVSEGRHLFVHRPDSPDWIDTKLIVNSDSTNLGVVGCEVRIHTNGQKAVYQLTKTNDPEHLWGIVFVKMENLSQGDISRTWDGVTILAQSEMWCNGTRLAVYLSDLRDGRHLLIHRPDSPDWVDSKLIVNFDSKNMTVNGCQITLIQMDMMNAVTLALPVEDGSGRWGLKFTGWFFQGFYRDWANVTKLQQIGTNCNGAHLAVYLADFNDGRHIVVHRENAPEWYDNRLITDANSHTLMVSGCEVRLTQGNRVALHRLVPTSDPVYAWRIEFITTENLVPPTVFRSFEEMQILEQTVTTCGDTELAVYLVGNQDKYLVANRADSVDAWDHNVPVGADSSGLTVSGCDVSLGGNQVSASSVISSTVDFKLYPSQDTVYVWQFEKVAPVEPEVPINPTTEPTVIPVDTPTPTQTPVSDPVATPTATPLPIDDGNDESNLLFLPLIVR